MDYVELHLAITRLRTKGPELIERAKGGDREALGDLLEVLVHEVLRLREELELMPIPPDS